MLKLSEFLARHAFGQALVRFVHELRVNTGDHRVRMTELPLQEEQVAPGVPVRQAPVRVAQKLDTGPIAQARCRENPLDAAIQARSLIRLPSLAEGQGPVEVVG
jgi:hypothetical protein